LRRLGDRPCLVDTVYIDNAARAHVLAGDTLAVGSAVAGKVYFVSNDDPLPLWEIVNRILATGDLPPVEKTISPRLAMVAGAILETAYRLLRLPGEPRMTRFVAKEMSTAHWFDLAAAKNDFGYQPEVTVDEGMIRLQEWLQREK
jgi:nucleoside-diphosphate-sugar epimerase